MPAKRKPKVKDPLEWINNYEKYLDATRPRVFNEDAYEIMRQDAASEEAAISALKRFGYLDENGNVAAIYRNEDA